MEYPIKIKGKTILLIAPGKSSIEERKKIASFINEDVVTISVNYNYPLVNTDYIFLSNLRRFRELDASNREKCIVTSNIPADNVYIQTKYRELLCDIEAVKDNAGLMAIKYFTQMGAKSHLELTSFVVTMTKRKITENPQWRLLQERQSLMQ